MIRAPPPPALAVAAEAGPPSRRQPLRVRAVLQRTPAAAASPLAVLAMAPPPRRAGAAVPGRHPLVLHAGMQDVGDGHADVVADRVWLRRRRPPQLHRRRRRALFSDLLGLAVGLVRSLRATTRLPLITAAAAAGTTATT
uniref:Uncharacterized protein n=1 Tax=Zea mays TaxID=4577 RepID=B7ZWZ1_MAIZE|nr:unknown [Zea mays]